MALIRLDYWILENDELMQIIKKEFESMSEEWDDSYRKFKDFRVTGDGVPEGDNYLVIEIYKGDGISPFIISVENDNR